MNSGSSRLKGRNNHRRVSQGNVDRLVEENKGLRALRKQNNQIIRIQNAVIEAYSHMIIPRDKQIPSKLGQLNRMKRKLRELEANPS